MPLSVRVNMLEVTYEATLTAWDGLD